jgi:hypothetical protein
MKNLYQKAGKLGILGKVLDILLIIIQEQQHSKILVMGSHLCKWKIKVNKGCLMKMWGLVCNVASSLAANSNFFGSRKRAQLKSWCPCLYYLIPEWICSMYFLNYIYIKHIIMANIYTVIIMYQGLF